MPSTQGNGISERSFVVSLHEKAQILSINNGTMVLFFISKGRIKGHFIYIR